ncbi:hypothetical protein MRB53_022014 [Persea americana]|uniref:Uncharacterized protein n=1 Tax=Persea americana TaxID=3435 RepID=A0ACC2L5B6_PERAE|nr:hypothetical protein MRB53_022014 [Persea americana]
MMSVASNSLLLVKSTGFVFSMGQRKNSEIPQEQYKYMHLKLESFFVLNIYHRYNFEWCCSDSSDNGILK